MFVHMSPARDSDFLLVGALARVQISPNDQLKQVFSEAMAAKKHKAAPQLQVAL